MAAALIALAVACCLLVGGTYAWQSRSQTALNEISGKGFGYTSVELVKLEKPVSTSAGGDEASPSAGADGEADAKPLAGAVFYLFTESGLQVGGRYVTDEDGRVRASLPAGSYYFEETAPPSGYAFDIVNGEVVTRYPFEVAEGEQGTVEVVAYNLRLQGSLSISKTVANADGSPLTDDQRAQAFAFSLELTKDGKPVAGKFDYSIDGMAAGSAGHGDVISLKHGQTATFESLPHGVLYTVTEKPVDGHAVASSGHRGTIGQTPSVAAFVNTHSEELVVEESGLVISKEARNADGSELTEDQAAQLFDFVVTFEGAADGDTEGVAGGEADGDPAASAEPYRYPYYLTGGESDSAGGSEGAGDSGAGDSESGEAGSGSTPADPNEPDGYITPESNTIRLSHGQTAVIKGVDPGLAYVVEEQTASLPDGWDAVIQRYEGLVPSGSAPTLPFVNVYGAHYQDSGSLLISKTVEGFDEGVDADADAFSFTVELSLGEQELGGRYAYYLDGAGPLYVESGGTIELAHGQTAVFPGLPKGASYKVTEQLPEGSAYEAHFTTAVGSIVSGDARVAFTNRAQLGSDEALIRVTKQLAGEYPAEDERKAFSFVLSYRTDEGERDVPFALLAGETGEFRIPLGAYYEVSEDDVYAQGYAQSIVNGAGHASSQMVEVVATNRYVGDVMTTVAGEKTWDLAGATGVALPDSITVYLKDGDRVVDQAEVSPDDAGRWLYSFTAPKYDASGNEVAYSVEEAYLAGFEPSYAGFDIENVYTPNASFEMPLVTKLVKGEGAPAEPFTFELVGLDGAPMPEGSVDGVKHVQLEGAGVVAFGSVAFAEAGTYAYRVSEVAGVAKGWTYDDASYVITVVVERSAAGGLVVAKSSIQLEKLALPGASLSTGSSFEGEDYRAAGTYVDSLEFENSYDAQAAGRVVSIDPPVVTKAVVGVDVPDTRFEFRMSARDVVAPMPEGAVDGVKSVFVDGSGSAEFGTISYVEPGTYVYDIIEVGGTDPAWTYDTTHYVLTVEVREAEDGALVSESLFKRLDPTYTGAEIVAGRGELLPSGADASFVNVYGAPDGGEGDGPGGSDGGSGGGSGGGGSGGKLEQTGDDTFATVYIIGGVVLCSLTLAMIAFVVLMRRRR